MTKKGICMYGNYQEGEFRNRQKEIQAYLILEEERTKSDISFGSVCITAVHKDVNWKIKDYQVNITLTAIMSKVHLSGLGKI